MCPIILLAAAHADYRKYIFNIEFEWTWSVAKAKKTNLNMLAKDVNMNLGYLDTDGEMKRMEQKPIRLF